MTFIKKSYINLKGGQVHCRKAGTGYPLILLHQTASSSVMYEALMQELGDTFLMIAPDTIGYGESYEPSQAPSIADYAQILDETLAALNINEAFFFGHHTGAAIAVEYAVKFPQKVKKLALSGPPLLSNAQKEALAKTLIKGNIPEDGSHLLKTWERIKSRSLTSNLELIQREVLLTIRAKRYHETYQAVFEQDFEGLVQQIDCPSLILCGEEDTLRASAEPTAKLLKNSKLIIIPNAGTYLCDEAPQIVAKHLKDFFLE